MDYYSSLDPSSLDPDKPTIFEILSAKQLQGLISPSLRYLLVFYAQRNPQYLLKIVNKYDEIFAVMMGLIEYKHLKTWNSSFTEKFYGLKRVRMLNVPTPMTRLNAESLYHEQTRLSRKQVLGGVFMLVAVPYIKEKLSQRYETLKGRYAFRSIEADREALQQQSNGDGNDKYNISTEKLLFELDVLIYKYYPAFKSMDSLLGLAFCLFYLFNQRSASGPADLLLHTKYSRFTQYDYLEADKRRNFALRTPVGALKYYAYSAFNYCLPTSMFLLKFVEWWGNSDFARQMSRKTRSGDDENLPPPEQPDPQYSSTDLCPLCHKEMTNPTAIETGVVYCYRCIFDYLQDADEATGGYCPVTGQKLLLCRFVDNKWQVGGLRRLVV